MGYRDLRDNSWTNTLVYDEMNASTGGIARGTDLNSGDGWTTLYTYSGKGHIAALLIATESFSNWEYRLIVDGNTIFTLASNDIADIDLYDLRYRDEINAGFLGFSKGDNNKIIWHPPGTSILHYSSSVSVQLRRTTGVDNRFEIGLIILSKDV